MGAIGPVEMLLCVCAVTAAFAVRGGTGFGASTIAIPIMAFAVPVTVAVPIISLLIILTSIPLVLRERGHIAWSEVLRTTPYSLVGVGIGLTIFVHVEDALLLRGLGVVAIAYGLFGLLAKGRVPEVRARWRPALAASTGLTGGSLAAVYGAGVAPVYAMYLNTLKLDKAVFRVTISAIMLVPTSVRVLGYGGLGYYDATVLTVLALSLPFMFIGTWIGDTTLRRINNERFGQLISLVLLLSGVGLLLR